MPVVPTSYRLSKAHGTLVTLLLRRGFISTLSTPVMCRFFTTQFTPLSASLLTTQADGIVHVHVHEYVHEYVHEANFSALLFQTHVLDLTTVNCQLSYSRTTS